MFNSKWSIYIIFIPYKRNSTVKFVYQDRRQVAIDLGGAVDRDTQWSDARSSMSDYIEYKYLTSRLLSLNNKIQVIEMKKRGRGLTRSE